MLIGDIVRWVIYSFILLTVGIPFLLVTGMMGTFGYFSDTRIDTPSNRANIATGADSKKLAAQLKHVRSTAAQPEEAPRNNRILHVAVIEVTDTNAPKVAIDLANAGKAGLLVIAEDPIAFSLNNASPAQRAKVAFESPGVFGIHNAHNGLVAGIRSSAFGANNISRPRHLTGEQNGRTTALGCNTLRIWARHFGVPVGEIGVWHFTDPSRIRISERGLAGSGGDDFIARNLDVNCFSDNSTTNSRGGVVIIRSRD